MNNLVKIGKVLIELDRIDSTNNYAKALLANNKPIEGTVIIAQEQTQGRGQIGNTWLSEAGKNITVSIILYPVSLRASESFSLNIGISLAIVELLETLGIRDIRVKWPNDIYTGKKKIAGILIENSIQGNHIHETVIGIGLNVNQESMRTLEDKASSVFLETGKNHPLPETLSALCRILEKQYLRILSHQNQKELYLNLLYQKDQNAQYRSGDRIFNGIIKDITEDGRLIVNTEQGFEKFAFKEIIFLS